MNNSAACQLMTTANISSVDDTEDIDIKTVTVHDVKAALENGDDVLVDRCARPPRMGYQRH